MGTPLTFFTVTVESAAKYGTSGEEFPTSTWTATESSEEINPAYLPKHFILQQAVQELKSCKQSSSAYFFGGHPSIQLN